MSAGEACPLRRDVAMLTGCVCDLAGLADSGARLFGVVTDARLERLVDTGVGELADFGREAEVPRCIGAGVAFACVSAVLDERAELGRWGVADPKAGFEILPLPFDEDGGPMAASLPGGLADFCEFARGFCFSSTAGRLFLEEEIDLVLPEREVAALAPHAFLGFAAD